jgi:Flp pilus assembly pilin Flp
MKILKDERGQGLTEYLILLLLIAIIAIPTVTQLGKNIRTKLTRAKNAVYHIKTDPDADSDGDGE